MNKYIELPTGDMIRADSIIAVRLGDPEPANPYISLPEMFPRVFIDYVVGDRGRCVVVDRATTEERDNLANRIKLKLLEFSAP